MSVRGKELTILVCELALNIVLRVGLEGELVLEAIAQTNLLYLSRCENMLVKVAPRKAPASNGPLQASAVALHRECPVCPNRSHRFDAVSDV